MQEYSTASLEHVLVPVGAKRAGAAVNPTGDTVQMAFLTTEAAPGVSDWKTASWETDSTTSPATYYALCLVGTGGAVALSAGVYNVYVKITDSPEVPARKSGQIRMI